MDNDGDTTVSQNRSGLNLNLVFGFCIGGLLGLVAGVLFAPKSGKAFQDDIQKIVDTLPEVVSSGVDASKTRYDEIVHKTRDGIETQISEHQRRKQAQRLAEAKKREAQETGYDL
jgi:gas vesicle protein